MCGDLEPENRLADDLYQRFLVQSQAMLARPSVGGELNRYLDGLFNDLLQRCVRDCEQGGDESGYAQMAMQAQVLARLAGFLAGHVALNEDPMRKAMEALMLGYQEAEAPPERDHHGHDHSHGDHHHGHHHGAHHDGDAHHHSHDHGHHHS